MKAELSKMDQIDISFLDAMEFVNVYTQQIIENRLFAPNNDWTGLISDCKIIFHFPINDDILELSATIESYTKSHPKGINFKLTPLSGEIREKIEHYLTEVLRGEIPKCRFKNDKDNNLKSFDNSSMQEKQTRLEKSSKNQTKQQEKSKENEEKEEVLKAHPTRSLQAQIREMSVNEKIQLALRGGKAARLLLIKDPQPVIHQYVLKNPRLTMEEIGQIAKNPTSSTEVIRLIGINSQYMSDPIIRWNIVRNPKLNTQIAISHLPRLSRNQLSILAKGQNTKSSISRAARKILNPH